MLARHVLVLKCLPENGNTDTEIINRYVSPGPSYKTYKTTSTSACQTYCGLIGYPFSARSGFDSATTDSTCGCSPEIQAGVQIAESLCTNYWSVLRKKIPTVTKNMLTLEIRLVREVLEPRKSHSHNSHMASQSV